ncbi:type II toxin-antitoxin system HicB family antitoxin [Blastopirellula retiformator]|uniref:HicB-like antitoxin of toxin-antitoxin system domain-containing protein n=1 Tax=Blastopirellula retiformator TaxID=2527970 RepID=A0A5C5VN86_9BACT|nr:hypothetical protein Enr8_10640 [Blastopirellula retiformator]
MRQVVLYPDLEDGGWIAEVPSLPGCLSQGDSKEEAIANVRDAIDTWIDGMQAAGQSIPSMSRSALCSAKRTKWKWSCLLSRFSILVICAEPSLRSGSRNSPDVAKGVTRSSNGLIRREGLLFRRGS